MPISSPFWTIITRPHCSITKMRSSPGTCTIASGAFKPVTTGSSFTLVWANAGPVTATRIVVASSLTVAFFMD